MYLFFDKGDSSFFTYCTVQAQYTTLNVMLSAFFFVQSLACIFTLFKQSTEQTSYTIHMNTNQDIFFKSVSNLIKISMKMFF